MSFYLRDYTTGEELAAGDNLAGLATLLVDAIKARPYHVLAVGNSADQPGPALNVAQAQFPHLYGLKLAQQQWKELLLPFVESLRRNGLLGAVSDAELQVFHSETLGLDVEAAGSEAVQHARLLRNELNGGRANAGRALVQKGPPEEMFSPEQLTAFQEDAETPQYRPLPDAEAPAAEVPYNEAAGELRPGGLAQAAQQLHAGEGLLYGVVSAVNSEAKAVIAELMKAYNAGQTGNMFVDFTSSQLEIFLNKQPITNLAGFATRAGIAPERWEQPSPGKYVYRSDNDPHADLVATGLKIAQVAAERGEAGYLPTESTRPVDRI